MSGLNNTSAKRSHQKSLFAFPSNLEIPESARNDRKFRSAYVHIFNDPRVYKRPRLNGDRTSSRFDVDHNYHVKVVFNEPPVKRKSILSNTQSPKDDSGKRKSVSFLSKITFIDSIDLDGVSSDWTDVEMDESRPKKSKTKSKMPKDGKTQNKVKKATAASNDKPSSKNNKKKTKDKSTNKNGHKAKSSQKELFKFKITKPFRKFGRSKDKKLKHLQKKFGRRMFKAFVQVKRSFNLKTIPDKVTVPLEKIALSPNTETPKKTAPSIQDFLIGRLTKKVKVSLTPVQGNTGGTNEPMIIDTEIIDSKKVELNSVENRENSSRTERDDHSDNPVDRQEMADNSETNQNISIAPTTKSSNSDQMDHQNHEKSIQSNGDVLPAETDDVKILSCNDTDPSPEVVESNALPNLIDEITCNMYYDTNKEDETVTTNGQLLGPEDDVHQGDVDENISTFNVSFAMPAKSLTDNLLGCDSPEIASIHLEMND